MAISERHLGDEIDEREGRELGDLTVVHLREEKPRIGADRLVPVGKWRRRRGEHLHARSPE